jgi:hypothetical protein
VEHGDDTNDTQKEEDGEVKWLRKSDPYPDVINGHPVRQPKGDCPSCGVDEKTWCVYGCDRLDVLDYR